MRTFRTLSLLAALALSLNLSACDSSEEPSATPPVEQETPDETPADETETPADETETPTEEARTVPEDCAYDDTNKGTSIGSHIENFKLKTVQGDNHELHYDCGGEAKAVWIFLSTGWCGACNTYAKRVEELYNQYKDQGLRVLWIVGEDDQHNPITADTLTEYVEAKGPMSYTVVRDPSFYATYSYIDNTNPALPHQYVLDPATMELVFKHGGVGDADGDGEADGEATILGLLGVK